MNKIQIVKNTIILIKIFFFIGCSSTQINETAKIESKNISKVSKQNSDSKPIYQLTKNEKDFLKVLKIDKYASLCSSQEKYLQIRNMEDSKEKTEALKELFYEYTNNLANSCIDKKAFKKVLKEKKYRNRNQFYELYKVKIDKNSLLKKFNSRFYTIEKILEKYTPKHPEFFELISKLDIKKLSKQEYNKLRLNIERLKLLKKYESGSFVQLNVPSYDFTLYEDNKKEKTFGTIVGKINKQTPILSSKVSHFIINPTWNIPDSIAKDTIIREALKDKNYLKRKNIVIRRNYNLNSKKFRFQDINWKKYLKKDVKYIPYKFIQLPSSTNGMGRVKFMFSNKYAVYMHDTIGKWRFKSEKEDIRFISHGCIRLEEPVSFMEYITQMYTQKSYESVKKRYENKEYGTINLNKKLPVHITYLTSKVKDEELVFYKDIYEYDKIQKLNFIPYINAQALTLLNKENIVNN